MTISSHKTHFAGRPIVDWSPGVTVLNPAETMFRLAIDYDSDISWPELFAKFLASPFAGFASGIVVGMWGTESDDSSDSVVPALAEARDRLPNLSAIFIGDITFEECEISWLMQTEMTPLLNAYPQLLHFGTRGGNDLGYSDLDHRHLRTLVVESGGLPAKVVHQILSAKLPSLEHLEIWFGDDNYGGDAKVGDLAPLLHGDLFPNLKHLGLRDANFADDIALAIVNSPLLDRLQTLDLSLGTLGDAGALALLTSPRIRSLKKLDLHHHYMSDANMQKFLNLGIEVDVSDQEGGGDAAEDDRYVAVSE